MEIIKCFDNSQTTFQYFKHGYSKSFHTQSGSFFEAFEIKPPKMTLLSTYFSVE
jgi:hypothetical protein